MRVRAASRETGERKVKPMSQGSANYDNIQILHSDYNKRLQRSADYACNTSAQDQIETQEELPKVKLDIQMFYQV